MENEKRDLLRGVSLFPEWAGDILAAVRKAVASVATSNAIKPEPTKEGDEGAAYALGFLDGIIDDTEKLGMHKKQVEAARQQWRILDNAIHYYVRALGEHLQKQVALQAELDASKKLTGAASISAADTGGATALLEQDFERRTNKMFVFIHRPDGSDFSPGRAFQDGHQVFMESPPFPHAYCLSAGELKAIVKTLEENRFVLPFESVG